MLRPIETIALLGLLLILYFTAPIVMVFAPAVVVGCIWPNEVVEIIGHNALPDSIVAWWVEIIQENAPSGWALQLNPTDGQYISCVKDQWWDLLVLTTGVVLPFMTVGMLLIYLFSRFVAFLVSKAL
jgi:hypothetical protein